MSKPKLEQEWIMKWVNTDIAKKYKPFELAVVDFFYSLHLEELEKIREKIKNLDTYLPNEAEHQMVELDDVLLTIAE